MLSTVLAAIESLGCLDLEDTAAWDTALAGFGEDPDHSAEEASISQAMEIICATRAAMMVR